MHTRRLVTFILGVWLGGILFSAYTTNANSSVTNRIIENPSDGARTLVGVEARGRAAMLLQHNTNELNRSMIEAWEWFQIAIGLALLGTLPFAVRFKWPYLIAAGIMLLIVIAQRALVTPQMIGVGRILDLAGNPSGAQDELWKQRTSLQTLSQLYIGLDIAKALVCTGLTASLLVFRQKASFKQRSARRLSNVDSIDDSDYSHINRGVGASDTGHR